MKSLNKVLIALASFLLLDAAAAWLLQEGMTRHYGLRQHSQVLVIGHSHMMLGIDKNLMEQGLGCKVSKYTRQGVGLHERHLMTEQYLDSPYSDSLKLALLGVDCWSFQGEGLSSNAYTLFYPFMGNDQVDRYIAENTDLPDYWLHKLIHLSRFNEEGLNVALSGWMGWDKNRKTHVLTKEEFDNRKANWDRPIAFNSELMKELETTIHELTDRGVHVLLVNTPTYRGINDAQPEAYQKIMAYYQQLADESPLVDFIDFNPQFQDSLDYFSDPIHLNVDGQRIITNELVKTFHVIPTAGSVSMVVFHQKSHH